MSDFKPSHVMVDLETMGTLANSPILSIGAARFNPNSDGIIDSFHVGVVLDEFVTVQSSTLLWWMAPERAPAREAWLALDKVSLYEALVGFGEWVRSMPTVGMWGNGAAFDNMMLNETYAKMAVTPVTPFWHDRCYRTIKSLAPSIKVERTGTYHSAVDDAVSQALHMQKVVQHLGITVPCEV